MTDAQHTHIGAPDVDHGHVELSAVVLSDEFVSTDAPASPEVAEYAHVHPTYDGSLHLALPVAQAADLVAKGWGAPHPWAGTRLTPGFVMVFGPRDAEELETVAGVLAASHRYASTPDGDDR